MNFIRRFQLLFRKGRLDAEMAEEMRLHVELQTERNLKAGLAPDEARYAALRQFGNVAAIQEQVREGRGWIWLEQFIRDLRHGGRQLAKTPGITALAVLSLAVGIGINSTIFSVMDAAFLRPLPLRDPGSVVKFERPLLSLAEFEQVRSEMKSLSGLVASCRFNVLLRDREGAQLLPARVVTDDYFEVLGIEPAAGRLFSARSPDLREPIVVISHALWQRRFGGDPAVIGQTITLSERALTVVGVAAKGITGEDRLPVTEFWYPAASQPRQLLAGRREFLMVGRLQPEATPAQVRAEAVTIFSRPEWKPLGESRWGERVRVVSERESRMDHGGRLTYIMGPVVGLVLLVACANVSCLLLGRYEQRRREIAVRLALGASRGRVLRYLLTEGALLALMGGGLGLALTAWGIRVVPSMLPVTLATFAPDVQVDRRVLGLTLGLAVFATLAFGLMPAWRASRLDVSAMLKSEGGHLGRTPSRNVLVVAQIAVAMLFLTLAALFVRGFWSGLSRDLGFSERNLLLAYVAPEGAARRNIDGLLDDLRRTVAALPGVRAVTFANTVVGSHRTMPVRVPDAESAEPITCNFVDAGFFATVGIPLQAGRDFTAHDNRGSGRVVIVSEAMARRLWPGKNPVGQTVFIGRTDPVPREVIGVAGNVSDVTERAPATQPLFYLPLRQEQSGDLMLIVNTRRPPAELAAATRDAVRRMDTPVTTFLIDTIEGRLRTALLPQWFGAWLGGVLGLLAFLLAVSGLYGVVAYAVARRTRELGIRIALGATSHDAVRLVLRQGIVLALIGVGVGLLLALAAGSLARGLLYGISPTDPLALVGSALIVLSVATLASYLPARRAAKVDPMIALRAE